MANLIDRGRAQLQRELKRKSIGLINDRLPDSFPRVPADASPRQLRAAADNALRTALSSLRGQSPAAAAGAERIAKNLRDQLAGRPATATVREAGRLITPASVAMPPPVSASPGGQAPGFSGLTPERARQIFAEAAAIRRAYKHMWHLEVMDPNPPEGGAPGRLINTLASTCTFGPCTINGSPTEVGSAVIDDVSSTERVELNMSVHDDEAGTIRRWFEGKCNQVASPDGTFGIPADYVVRVTVTHMDVEGDKPLGSVLRHRYWMRPVSLEVDLSRGEHALEETPLRFVEFDTVIAAY